jgi:uncharacterized protein YndB with AHSA1/START domain
VADVGAEQAVRFRYRWNIEGPIESVFALVADARTFPRWFHAFESVATSSPTERVRVGTEAWCRAQAFLPYRADWRILVTEYRPPSEVVTACHVCIGGRIDLTGTVRFRLTQRGPITTVVNEQDFRTDRPLPWWLPFRLCAAAFRFNHDWTMARARAPLQSAVTAAVARDSQGTP